MRKTLIASAIAAAGTGVFLELKRYDLDEPNFTLKDPFHGKRGKKGRAKKDWQR